MKDEWDNGSFTDAFARYNFTIESLDKMSFSDVFALYNFTIQALKQYSDAYSEAQQHGNDLLKKHALKQAKYNTSVRLFLEKYLTTRQQQLFPPEQEPTK